MPIPKDFPFQTLSPHWPDLPHIQAYTVLAQAPNGTPISFKGPEGGQRPEKSSLESHAGTIHWLHQVHEADILEIPFEAQKAHADGVVTSHSKTPCAIRTADCLPVLFTNSKGTRVGAAHAGWRGLHAKILPAMVDCFEEAPHELRAWIGPGIAQRSYEVGIDMQERFIAQNDAFAAAFQPRKPGKCYADLALIARIQLITKGLAPDQISGGTWDTFTDPNLHSFRRDGEASGRMVSLIRILPSR